jgi:hypothetical protein
VSLTNARGSDRCASRTTSPPEAILVTARHGFARALGTSESPRVSDALGRARRGFVAHRKTVVSNSRS